MIYIIGYIAIAILLRFLDCFFDVLKDGYDDRLMFAVGWPVVPFIIIVMGVTYLLCQVPYGPGGLGIYFYNKRKNRKQVKESNLLKRKKVIQNMSVDLWE